MSLPATRMPPAKVLLGAGCCLLLALFDLASGQEVLLEVQGQAPNDKLGSTLARIGDQDGDGRTDLLTGGSAGPIAPGQAWVISSATGAVLRSFRGTSNGDYLGAALCGTGDLDSDGVSEYVIGAPGWPAANYRGQVQVVSGATGAVLHQWDGDEDDDYFGQALDSLPDLDGDGVDEVLVGAPYFDPSDPFGDVGYLRIFSGASGTRLRDHTPRSGEIGFGSSVAALGDLDGDGWEDYGTTAQGVNVLYVYSGVDGALLHQEPLQPQDYPIFVTGVGDLDGDRVPDLALTGFQSYRPPYQGLVQYFSGATFQEFRRLLGPDMSQTPFWEPADLGDLDGDGWNDLLVGDFIAAIGDGQALLFSGRTGKTLYRFDGEGYRDFLGSAVAAAGDQDGDGRPDYWVGAAGDAAAPGNPNGRARLHRGADLHLLATPRIALVGDTVELALRECSAGDPSLLAITSWNGSPVVWPVLGVRPMNGKGARREFLVIPASLQGSSLGFTGFALCGARVRVTAEETLLVQ